MEEEERSVTPNETFAGFPEEIQNDVDGLTWLGYLEDEFDWAGHTFVIRTLRGQEELLAELVAKEFTDSNVDYAPMWATVALALVSIDGDADFCPPIGNDPKIYARGRFQWIIKNWYAPTVAQVFARYAGLLQRQADSIRAVEDLFERGLPTFTPSEDSSTSRGTSAQPQEDIRDYLGD